jgi:hypothetical protein
MAVIKERGPTTFAEAHGSLGHVVACKTIPKMSSASFLLGRTQTSRGGKE